MPQPATMSNTTLSAAAGFVIGVRTPLADRGKDDANDPPEHVETRHGATVWPICLCEADLSPHVGGFALRGLQLDGQGRHLEAHLCGFDDARGGVAAARCFADGANVDDADVVEHSVEG